MKAVDDLVYSMNTNNNNNNNSINVSRNLIAQYYQYYDGCADMRPLDSQYHRNIPSKYICFYSQLKNCPTFSDDSSNSGD